MLQGRKEKYDESPDIVVFVKFLTKWKNFLAESNFFGFVTKGQKPEIFNGVLSKREQQDILWPNYWTIPLLSSDPSKFWTVPKRLHSSIYSPCPALWSNNNFWPHLFGHHSKNLIFVTLGARRKKQFVLACLTKHTKATF
jgi:hypothetical protein